MIIGISGKAQSGKDTVGKLLQKYFYENRERGVILSEWEIKKFAGKLKKVASLMLGCQEYAFENINYKSKNLGNEWGGMTVREFLQKLGTEAVRNNLHTNAWVNATFADYETTYPVHDKEGALVIPPTTKKWIITDVRFPNEAQAIKDRGGVLIRVNRPGIPVGEHPSEIALDDYTGFDYVIGNDTDLRNLELTVLILGAAIKENHPEI